MAETYPVTSLDTDALEAARLMGEHRMPGLVVTDADGCPHSVLGASQVVRFLVPSYVQDDPTLARVIDEQFADKVADKLSGHTVRELLPRERPELAVAEADDTIIEVAAVMASMRCPLVAVVENKQIIGVITASRLLELALPH
nr:FIG00822000: hypothetical protein [Kibdelosporangium sp. MJ126-NF4]CEL17588.1 FIG00822000: hypothetical protein [Kibdelosporangium sp. MJ126-NF4]CTQ91186.1 FIG00822000: hypothetical protein [Kibdelosporangium sp. MJ126-NF4]CTQ98995.1 FIG00822000: hypothetical protein [Kibdelosporangium sp. MJ126-NF4]